MFRHKLFGLISIVVFCSGICLGTVQRPNRILFEGTNYEVCSDPLEEYFEKFPDKQPKNIARFTNLWRGYVATFEIGGGMLTLRDIEAYVEEKNEDGISRNSWGSVLKNISPTNERLKIDWFTGLLVVPYGEMRHLDYEEYDCELRYENYFILEIKNGKFTKSIKFESFLSYTKFKTRQFMAFRKTDDYKKLVKEMKAGGRKADSIEAIINDLILTYSKRILVK